MYRSQDLLLFMALLSFSAGEDASSNKGDIILTSTSQKLWKLMKNGIPGLVAPFNTLHKNRIIIKTPEIEGTLTNVTYRGMDRCHVEKLTLKPKVYTFLFVAYCQYLDLTGNYAVKGTLDSQPIDSKGSFHTKLENYTVTIIGQDIKYVDKRDKMARLYVINFGIENETIANASCTCKTFQNEDEGQVDLVATYFAELWLFEDKEEQEHDPIMLGFWAIYMKDLDNILKLVPFTDIMHLSLEDLRTSVKKRSMNSSPQRRDDDDDGRKPVS